jgi:hypothetical protein
VDHLASQITAQHLISGTIILFCFHLSGNSCGPSRRPTELTTCRILARGSIPYRRQNPLASTGPEFDRQLGTLTFLLFLDSGLDASAREHCCDFFGVIMRMPAHNSGSLVGRGCGGVSRAFLTSITGSAASGSRTWQPPACLPGQGIQRSPYQRSLAQEKPKFGGASEFRP